MPSQLRRQKQYDNRHHHTTVSSVRPVGRGLGVCDLRNGGWGVCGPKNGGLAGAMHQLVEPLGRTSRFGVLFLPRATFATEGGSHAAAAYREVVPPMDRQTKPTRSQESHQTAPATGSNTCQAATPGTDSSDPAEQPNIMDEYLGISPMGMKPMTRPPINRCLPAMSTKEPWSPLGLGTNQPGQYQTGAAYCKLYTRQRTVIW
ncbi:hypothetical protein HRR83_008557 [Exophiala dermatitidis]|nr:hypothetical protein HRR73_008372 [Exophiala dermatitidis]KAJ4506078.1 hypothetical protein HRR74_008508 [Exophiala dermatitidis]KAJ4536542.1 hypothetical protein HRR76_004578 [Exophiala dermatitidis]KAJ4555852.1 hypothetical protein HRR77_001771 [Exophiala dermatitidis]KAJ4559397.1 hypothetical protein HRR79_008175 [Exophiala dermatitidis]